MMMISLNSLTTTYILGLLSTFVTFSIGQSTSETTEEYHQRLDTLLQDAFHSQDETTAWWVGFSHPTHGDQHWTFGNSSDTDGTFPPDVPATTDDHFYIGSVSKSFGATVNLQLAERGDFALTDTVSDIVPDFAAHFPQYANYTPVELMGMQTVVPDFLNDPEGLMADLIADPSLRFTIPELVEFALQKYPTTLPAEYVTYFEENGLTLEDVGVFGPYTEYSTTNIVVMEHIAEAVTGMSMQSLVASLVTLPLGLTKTVEPPRDAPAGTILPEPAVRTYVGQGCVNEIKDVGGTASVGDRMDALDDSIVSTGTGGAMYSTIVDLLQWSKSGLGDSFLSAETVATRHEFKTTSLGLSYGLGIQVFDDAILPPYDPLLGAGWFGHRGDAFGSNTRAWTNAELGTSFASAINTCGYGGLHGKGFQILVSDATSAGSTEAPTDGSAATVAPTPETATSAPTESEGATTSAPTVSEGTTPAPTPAATTSAGSMESLSTFVAVFCAVWAWAL